MPGKLVVDSGLDAVFRVGAAVEVLGKQGLALGVGNEIVEQELKLLRRKAAVLLPPHRLLAALVGDDELVLGTAAGMGAGLGAEGAAAHEDAFAIGDRVLDQDCVRQIPVDRRSVVQAKLVGAMGAIPQTRFLHASLRNASGSVGR